VFYLPTTDYKSTIVRGALILTISNVLVKVLSALYIIPLTNLIGEQGMGYLNSAYTIYIIIFIIATAGLPVAISKMVASANALGRFNESRRILKVAIFVYIFVSLFLTVFLISGASFLSGFLNNPYSYYSFIVVAPSILIITATAAIKGYFQGYSNMVPTAIANLIEAVTKCFFGLLIPYLLLKKGYSLPIVSAGAISGVTIGSFASGIYILLVFLIKRLKSALPAYIKALPSRKSPEILKEFLALALPVMISALSLNMTNAMDLVLIMKRLVASGLSAQQANILYGSYSSMAVTFFNMPTLIILGISTSIIPAIAAAFAINNKRRINNTINYTYKVTSILATPMAIGISFFAYPILNLLFSSRPIGVGIAVPLLTVLSLAVIPLCLACITNAIFLSIGKPFIPVFSILIGGAVKLIVNYILIGIPSVRMMGAPISTNICYIIIVILNFYWLYKYTNVYPKIIEVFVKPIICALGCCLVAYFAYYYLGKFINFKVSLLIAMPIGAIIYVVLLFLSGLVDKNDEIIKKIVKTFQKYLKIKDR